MLGWVPNRKAMADSFPILPPIPLHYATCTISDDLAVNETMTFQVTEIHSQPHVMPESPSPDKHDTALKTKQPMKYTIDITEAADGQPAILGTDSPRPRNDAVCFCCTAVAESHTDQLREDNCGVTRNCGPDTRAITRASYDGRHSRILGSSISADDVTWRKKDAFYHSALPSLDRRRKTQSGLIPCLVERIPAYRGLAMHAPITALLKCDSAFRPAVKLRPAYAIVTNHQRLGVKAAGRHYRKIHDNKNLISSRWLVSRHLMNYRRLVEEPQKSDQMLWPALAMIVFIPNCLTSCTIFRFVSSTSWNMIAKEKAHMWICQHHLDNHHLEGHHFLLCIMVVNEISYHRWYTEMHDATIPWEHVCSQSYICNKGDDDDVLDQSVIIGRGVLLSVPVETSIPMQTCGSRSRPRNDKERYEGDSLSAASRSDEEFQHRDGRNGGGVGAANSEARVDGLLRPAQFALDLTAPVEGARAPLHDNHLLSPVASAAAHEVAAVDADGRVVALAAVRALDAQAGVALAEPGGGLEVHEVLHPWRLVVRVVGLQLEGVPLALASPGLAAQAAGVAHHDARRAVEPVLEVVADQPEAGQPHPARLDGARTRHPVALALLPHVGRHVLRTTQSNIFCSGVVVWRLASLPGETVRFPPGLPPYDTSGRRVLSGISRFSRPCIPFRLQLRDGSTTIVEEMVDVTMFSVGLREWILKFNRKCENLIDGKRRWRTSVDTAPARVTISRSRDNLELDGTVCDMKKGRCSRKRTTTKEVGGGEVFRDGADDIGKKDWRRNGMESAMVFVSDPSQHSPGVISENHAGRGLNPEPHEHGTDMPPLVQWRDLRAGECQGGRLPHATWHRNERMLRATLARAAGTQGRPGKREIPEKTHLSDTIPTREDPGVTPAGNRTRGPAACPDTLELCSGTLIPSCGDRNHTPMRARNILEREPSDAGRLLHIHTGPQSRMPLRPPWSIAGMQKRRQMGDPRGNPSTSGVVRHDSHSGSDPRRELNPVSAGGRLVV
ncbi:hypothetical protein PR048_031419 [Dryococelus australis]|uniref:Uncharacterized protein n=1 Tax=Dryococelus australis TaxID=614101 RepID=A0ABQ9G998_9NEOP|nr:hypothetical protein PR048_031419 [Dryococelus australis]